ncbi:MAG TPA: MarR family transcriptional regulator [Amycolatopsis sp.]|nr:MarR family transcriptional regulator [Amycolatopsis sp.]
MQKPTRAPIGLLLANTAKALNRAFDDTLAAAGGSVPVWLILITLKTQPRASQREIAAAVGIQGATLTHHLNSMEKDGLITRTRDPENRRVHQVRLTDKGEETFHRLADAARAHDQRLRAGFSEDDLETLEKLLTRMRANVTG